MTEDLAFGLADVRITRPVNFIDGGNARSAIRHGSDRLNATDAINFIDPDEVQRGEQSVGDFARGIRRREHRDLRATGDLGERGGHEDRGNERNLAAGYVEADAPDRVKFFTDEGALGIFGRPIFTEPAAVEGHNTVMRGHERATLGRRKALGGRGDIGGLEAEFFGAQFGPVEFGGVVAHGFVPALADVGKDGRDRIADLARHI